MKVDFSVKTVGHEPNFKDRTTLPAVLSGLKLTFGHIFKPKKYHPDEHPTGTIFYPEQKRKPYKGYRGAHRLNKDKDGRIKCVACEMCATACPADAIKIKAEPTPPEWEDRERMPEKFEINMLRCIYCGFCEEACPKEAIELTEVYDFVDYTRESLIWDRDKLLDMYDKTKDGDYYSE